MALEAPVKGTIPDTKGSRTVLEFHSLCSKLDLIPEESESLASIRIAQVYQSNPSGCEHGEMPKEIAHVMPLGPILCKWSSQECEMTLLRTEVFLAGVHRSAVSISQRIHRDKTHCFIVTIPVVHFFSIRPWSEGPMRPIPIGKRGEGEMEKKNRTGMAPCPWGPGSGRRRRTICKGKLALILCRVRRRRTMSVIFFWLLWASANQN